MLSLKTHKNANNLRTAYAVDVTLVPNVAKDSHVCLSLLET